MVGSLRDLLADRELDSVQPDVTVRLACHTLDARDVGAVVVLTDATLVGILSERDVIRKCVCSGRRTDETLVSDIMTPNPVVIDINCSITKALDTMRAGGFRHLPVMEGTAVVGLLSMRDIPTQNRLMLQRYQEYTSRLATPT
jgi:CBS domain-containing protein